MQYLSTAVSPYMDVCGYYSEVTYSILDYEMCGYPDCLKPCYVNHTTGETYRFCGKSHATQYKQLQMSEPPIHSSTHQITASTREASRGKRLSKP